LSPSLPTLQADLARQYLKAGLKNVGTVVLLSDSQLPEEQLLVLLNDFLASGE
ncbi:DYH17 protein, partial [Ramphastos sulfuratus]|nr:DYH17 protein [Ramphastos sulfuratus]